MAARSLRSSLLAGAALAVLALGGAVAARADAPPPAAAAAAAAPLSAPAAPAATIDPFYSTLLIDGAHAYDRRDFAAAARHLRLACFGYLEAPRALAGCLTRLGAAQAAAGDQQGFADTFGRIVEVEERFAAYSKAEVPPEVRTAFEQRVTAAIPKATLAAVPVFAPLAAKKTEAVAVLSPKQRRRAAAEEERKKKAAGATQQAAAGAAPKATAKTPARAPAKTPAKPAPAPTQAGTAKGRGKAAAPVVGPAQPKTEPVPAAPAPAVPAAAATAPTQAAAPGALAAPELAAMAEARRLLASNAPDDLRRALKLAREVADAHPDSRPAQHLAAEAAYRGARWQDASSYFRRGGDPGDGQPELLFYMAVSLYESGDAAGAASALERSLPNLERTPYVESYAKRILRPRAGSAPGGRR